MKERDIAEEMYQEVKTIYEIKEKNNELTKYEKDLFYTANLFRVRSKELKCFYDNLKDELNKTINKEPPSIIVYEPMCVSQFGGVTHGSNKIKVVSSPEFKITLEEAFIHLKNFANDNYENIKKASPNKKVKLKKKTFRYKTRDYAQPVSFESKKNNCLFMIKSNGKILQKFFIERREIKYPENCGMSFADWKNMFKEKHNLI